LHGILKSNLHETIAGINACLLTTLGACGDVSRNVMACPAPHHDGVHCTLQETAKTLALDLAPRSRAYHEFWLNGKQVEPSIEANDGVPREEGRGGDREIGRQDAVSVSPSPLLPISPSSLTTHDLPVTTRQDDVEPIYGKVYLPRKFK